MNVSGVRFFSVIFVILFNLWPDHFANGFLGIDMFVVTTGFLTYLALSAEKMSFSNVLAFYFQGVRQFIPPYLLFVLLTALISSSISDKMHSSQTYYEILTAAAFSSNVLGFERNGSTKIGEDNSVFYHTRAVSIAVQFCAIAPAVYSIYSYLSSLHRTLGATFVMALGLMSLTFQTYHHDAVAMTEMHFFSRLWQFLLGFLTVALKQHDFEQFQSLPTNKEKSKKSTYLRYIFSIQNLAMILLLAQLIFPIMSLTWSKRFVISMTMSVLLYHYDSALYECSIAELLDNSSYWMYLICWPAVSIVNHFYLASQTFTTYDKLSLFGIIVSFGITVELLREYLTRWIQTWCQLITLLVILYTTTVSVALFMAGSFKTHVETNMTLEYLNIY